MNLNALMIFAMIGIVATGAFIGVIGYFALAFTIEGWIGYFDRRKHK